MRTRRQGTIRGQVGCALNAKGVVATTRRHDTLWHVRWPTGRPSGVVGDPQEEPDDSGHEC